MSDIKETATVTLVSNDDVKIVVGKSYCEVIVGEVPANLACLAARPVIERSLLIKNMLEDFGTEGTPSEEIPIPNVSLPPHQTRCQPIHNPGN